MLITEALPAALGLLCCRGAEEGLVLLTPTPGEGSCAERGFPLLPAEDLGLSSPTAHPTINEQPGYHLNFNDITDTVLLIAHLLIWNEF